MSKGLQNIKCKTCLANAKKSLQEPYPGYFNLFQTFGVTPIEEEQDQLAEHAPATNIEPCGLQDPSGKRMTSKFFQIETLNTCITNKTGFRLVSRQQQDRFRNKLYSHLSCRLIADFFMPAFWTAFLSTQYKRCAILSMQYKSLVPFFRGGGGVGRGVCVEVSLRTACCCQK